jgi:hypothetical protein
MAYKGKYKPQNSHKYIGDFNNIIYRSLWERKFMVFCDLNENVLKWGSEEIYVPYVSPIDNKIHRYFIDFFVEMKTKNGTEKYLIEVKPFKKCHPPIQRNSSKYVQELNEWKVNTSKWKSATNFAQKNDLKFKILTEKELNI